ncbi:Uncharacterised protein [Mycobacterium tuberculosis]|uniref:Uncharacterized protein n=1 Tax=Mycobacterium tuberculosis TaxID=1773 RepID=A0A655J1N5_MYCTX|nr:Uncharacterised protein [Mycobacterium tuberculosis]
MAPTRTRARSASAARARASNSSIRCTLSEIVSSVNVKVGVNRTPVPAPTLVRSTPLARSSAAAAPAQFGSSCSVRPITV